MAPFFVDCFLTATCSLIPVDFFFFLAIIRIVIGYAGFF